MSVIRQSKKQRLTLNDKYKEFLASGARSKDNSSNSLNLFDDLNRKDKVWLRATRDYLNKRG